MKSLDPLLKMMAELGGDELHLVAGEPPRMLAGGRPLKFTLPPMGEKLLRTMLGAAAVDRISLDHELYGAFVLEPTPGAPLEVRIRRGSEAPSEAPAGALVALLERAVESGASDVHLTTDEPPTLRVDGRLRTLDEHPPVPLEELLGAAGEEGRATFESSDAADFAMELPGRVRLRGNVYRHARGVAAAFRVLDRLAPRLESLGLPAPLQEFAAMPHGLVIVCGPTGSGKSTTVAALCQHALEMRGGVLVTLEDPIEYVVTAPRGALVRQRQVGRDVRGFDVGLRDALREDPDLLLVGEMRDQATVALALTAAETGHLVLSTLHSRSAASAVERIVDAYPSTQQGQVRAQLADALRAVVVQRLLPRAGGPGRVVATEVLRCTSNVAGLIRDGRTAGIASALQAGGAAGMIPLERSLAGLVRAGRVRLDDALAVANDTEGLRTYLSE